jgi:hypothetical protein
MNKILIATDGSASAAEVEFGLDLAEKQERRSSSSTSFAARMGRRSRACSVKLPHVPSDADRQPCGSRSSAEVRSHRMDEFSPVTLSTRSSPTRTPSTPT